MAINVSQAFHRTSANPVDESMALTKAQMLTVNDNLMPAYYFTICQDDGEIYLYDKTATPSATTGKFTKFEGGGGGGGSTEGVVITKTLLASGWNSTTKQQTLTFGGYDADMGGVVGMPTNATAAQKEAYVEAIIDVVSQNGNVFTFQCEEIPSIDLPVTLYAGGGSGGSGGGAEAFIITITMDDSGNFSADKTPKELEDALAENAIAKAYFPTYGLTLDLNVNASGNFAFSGFYIEDGSNPSSSAFATILLVKDTDTTWSSVNFQTIQGDDFSKEVRSNNGILTQPTIYLNDVDHVEDEDNERDDIYPHRLTASEMAEIMSTLPGATTNYPKYSTTEQVVGEWVDGKPLYQKTFCGKSASSTTWNTVGTLDSSAIPVNYNSFVLKSRANEYYALCGNTNYGFLLKVDAQHHLLVHAQTSDFYDCDVTVTVQYTKTTD